MKRFLIFPLFLTFFWMFEVQAQYYNIYCSANVRTLGEVYIPMRISTKGDCVGNYNDVSGDGTQVNGHDTFLHVNGYIEPSQNVIGRPTVTIIVDTVNQINILKSPQPDARSITNLDRTHIVSEEIFNETQPIDPPLPVAYYNALFDLRNLSSEVLYTHTVGSKKYSCREDINNSKGDVVFGISAPSPIGVSVYQRNGNDLDLKPYIIYKNIDEQIIVKPVTITGLNVANYKFDIQYSYDNIKWYTIADNKFSKDTNIIIDRNALQFPTIVVPVEDTTDIPIDDPRAVKTIVTPTNVGGQLVANQFESESRIANLNSNNTSSGDIIIQPPVTVRKGRTAFVYFKSRIIRETGGVTVLKNSPWSAVSKFEFIRLPDVSFTYDSIKCYGAMTKAYFTIDNFLSTDKELTIFRLEPGSQVKSKKIVNINNQTSTVVWDSLVGGDYNFQYRLDTRDGNNFASPEIHKFSIKQRPEIKHTAVINNVLCYDNSTGEINGTASGGTGTFKYSWNGQEFKENAEDTTNLKAGTYKLKIKDANECISKEFAYEVTQNPPLDSGAIDSTQTICFNTQPTPFTSIADAKGGNGTTYNYQWYKSTDNGLQWNEIPSSNDPKYTESNLTQTTLYKRVVKSEESCPSKETKPITVNVYPKLKAGEIDIAQTICYETAPLPLAEKIHPSGGKGTYTYQWQSSTGNNGWADIENEVDSTYAPSVLSTSTYFRRNVTSGECGTVSSDSIKITVNDKLTAGAVGNDQKICFGTVPAILNQITAASGAFGDYKYTWQKSTDKDTWVDIDNSNTPSYAPGALIESYFYRRNVKSGACATVNSESVFVKVYDPLTAGVIRSIQDPICYGTKPVDLTESNGATGGTGIYGYQWQRSADNVNWSDITGATDVTYSPPALTSSTYFRRTVISGACEIVHSESVMIKVYEKLTGGTIGDNQFICYGTKPSEFKSTAAPTGGDGKYFYQWMKSINNGLTYSYINGANASSYAETANITAVTYYKRVVTSGCGSAESEPIKVSVYGMLNGGSIGSNQEICSGGSLNEFKSEVDPSGGYGIWSYVWEKKEDTGSWTILAGANQSTYAPPKGLSQTTSFRRISTNSCGVPKESNQVVVAVNPLPNAFVGTNRSICQGQSTTLGAASVAGNTYSWVSNPIGFTSSLSNPSVVSTATTTYTLVETTSKSCTSTNNVVVTVNPNPILGSPNITHVICYGGETGKISITSSGGTPLYNYELTNASINPQLSFDGNFTGLKAANDYYITVTDANGCTDTKGGIVVTQPSTQFKLIVTDFQNISCNGGSNGWAELKAEGGFPGGSMPYYHFSKDSTNWMPSSNNYRFDNLAYSNEPFSVKDANECVVNAVNPVSQPNAIALESAVVSHVKCKGGSNGKLRVNVTGGTGQYMLMLTGAKSAAQFKIGIDSSAEFEGLNADTYSLDIKDANNCSFSKQFEVLEPVSPISLTFAPVLPTCNGFSDGEIAVVPSGGWGKSSYVFANLSNGSIYNNGKFSSVGAKTYEVSVTDSLGCVYSNPITLSEPQKLIVKEVKPVNLKCFGDGRGEFNVVVDGGTPGYQYDFGAGYQLQNIYQGLQANTYHFKVKDSNGCETLGEATITQPAKLGLIKGNGTIQECKDNVLITPQGGTAPYSLWVNETTVGCPATGYLIDKLPNGNYAIRLTDNNNCWVEDNISLSTLPAPTISLLTVTPAKCANLADGKITVSPFTQTLSVVVKWDDGFIGDTYENCKPGTYRAIATDEYGCTSQPLTVTVGSPPPITIVKKQVRDPKCHGYADGNIWAVASGGNSAFTYKWFDLKGLQVSNIDSTGIVLAGSYYVVARDIVGCKDSTLFTLTDPPSLQPNLIPTVTICANQKSYEADAGIEANSYIWTSPAGFNATTRVASLSEPGTYSLIISDSKGCQGNASLTLLRSDREISANFIVADKAYVGDTLVLIEMSWPIPEVIEWEYPSSFEKKDGNDYSVYLVPTVEGNFNLKLTSHVGECWADITKTIVVGPARDKRDNSIQQRLIESVTAYPNPNNGNFSVEVMLTQSHDAVLEIYSLYGQRLYANYGKGLTDYKFIVNQFRTPGIYLVRVTVGNEQRSLRVIVQ